MRELADFGVRLKGLEISQAAVNQCIQRGLDVSLFNGSRIPFEDRAFDLAILTHVVEHLENPREVLYEAARVAQYVFVEVPLEDNFHLKMNFVPNDVGHINFYSLKTFRQLLQTCRMQIKGQKLSHSRLKGYQYRLGTKGYAAWAVKSMVLLFPRIASALWTYHYSLLATTVPSSNL
jgi:ubiquinone/menaquinone biosynthesis C-methylase UbiE